jgi:hypothetical protein
MRGGRKLGDGSEALCRVRVRSAAAAWRDTRVKPGLDLAQGHAGTIPAFRFDSGQPHYAFPDRNPDSARAVIAERKLDSRKPGVRA